ncbi:MAG TPA: aromatic ring-hydroxylating dioxygenase subunit alpha [Ramlibacter sp.]|uniref:aromatic ring-hydroxylating oxygenase subunit alpha n=1 Tax=Ramlibacter sp. TaxID=1917967 RepID=UPI002D1C6D15|nr:aromatic ring-hydroxylating dioxygenase subunit alpha [Ramlibacter sp.]HVZ45420.1 aromatic ring-hydroxylating dioxygenase subunit alpha [Ramlibacter sp.]
MPAQDSTTRPIQFEKTRRPLPEASHAPGFIYHSEEVLAEEKRKIFLKEWLCVARSEEVGEPGSYMTLGILGEPIVITRDAQGRINCFANMCLHRGVEVAYGCGHAEEFSCPYHAWRYDLSGRLVSASYMRESCGFDPKAVRLKPIAVGEWTGWVFINLADDPKPLQDHLEFFSRDLGFLKMEDCRIGSKLVIDLKANWKFVVENLMDIYHARTLHINTFGKFRSSPEKHPTEPRPNGGTFMIYEAAPMTPDGKTLFGRMPAIADRGDSFACSSHLFPNMQVIARSDNIHPLVMWPVTANTSRTIVYNLFPKEFLEQPGAHERVKVYDDYIHVVLEEDRLMMDSLQRAVQSKNYEPGRMSTLEVGIYTVVNDYLDRMFGSR